MVATLRFVVPQRVMWCLSPRDFRTGSAWEDRTTAKPVGRPWIRLAVPWARIAGERENTLEDSRCQGWLPLPGDRLKCSLFNINMHLPMMSSFNRPLPPIITTSHNITTDFPRTFCSAVL
jgi:hypothetical protein